MCFNTSPEGWGFLRLQISLWTIPKKGMGMGVSRIPAALGIAPTLAHRVVFIGGSTVPCAVWQPFPRGSTGAGWAKAAAGLVSVSPTPRRRVTSHPLPALAHCPGCRFPGGLRGRGSVPGPGSFRPGTRQQGAGASHSSRAPGAGVSL